MSSRSIIGAVTTAAFAHLAGADDGSYKVLDLPETPIPTTVADAVSDVLRGMSDQDKQLVRSTPKADLIKFLRGWGMGIRNGYRLWTTNDKLRISACGEGVDCNAERASMVIIEAVWAELQK